MPYTTVTVEGGLLPSEMLDEIANGKIFGQHAVDFGLSQKQRVDDDISAAWADLSIYWNAFQSLLNRSKGAHTQTITYDHWVKPLLLLLQFHDLTPLREPIMVNDIPFPISHTVGDHPDALPIHIIGLGESLDKRKRGHIFSPHGYLQEFLNATDHLWSILTNGEQLRLIRTSNRIMTQTYIEFNLRALIEGQHFSDFTLLYRLLHRTRFPTDPTDAHTCWLEKYRQQAIEQGGRIREGLRDSVVEALRHLGSGFLQHPHNYELRQKIEHGYLSHHDLYRQLLRLIYRLLFLMVAEDRRLIVALPNHISSIDVPIQRPPPELRLTYYRQYYSITRIRRLAEATINTDTRFDDLWHALLTTFGLFEGSDENALRAFGIAPLDGDLFGPTAIPELANHCIHNTHIILAMKALSLYLDPESKHMRRVNYGALDVEELGSVYESLLEERPVVRGLLFELAKGTERKTTGSYYTNADLVAQLIESALDPIIESCVAEGDAAAKEQALLSLSVCDPACGSGHFLLAAARRIGRALAEVRTKEAYPSPEEQRRAIRDVITRCIYGVDINPLAVDLCKLALWIEGYTDGLPLSFLDSHIRQGNSLVGAIPTLVDHGIPDDAYKPLPGDPKALLLATKKRNRDERTLWLGQRRIQEHLFGEQPNLHADALANELRLLHTTDDIDILTIREKARRYADMRRRADSLFRRSDLWTAAFFQPPTLAEPITTKLLLDSDRLPPDHPTLLVAQDLAAELRFFHWHLEFSHVFHRGGFDVVLGNPPWERIKLQEKEHFIDVPDICGAHNAAARAKIIHDWRRSSHQHQRERIAQFDHAKRRAENTSRFVRASGRFPLTATGDVNTYALFAELACSIMHPSGRAGIIAPTGIATDDTTKHFFESLTMQQRLISLYDFENREGLFPGVHRSYKFSLLTIGQTTQPTRFLFFATNTKHIEDEQRNFTLTPDEICLINPNTRTSPTFRTRADADLTKAIYARVPVLVNERTKENPWGVSFQAMFHMANDSHLFQNAPGENLVPLYEAKMIHQYTHRWATYEKKTIRDSTPDELANPDYTITPRYWVKRTEVQIRLRGRWERPWLLGFRRICRSTDEHTAIFCIFPQVAVGDSVALIYPDSTYSAAHTACFLAMVNSLVFDYVTRQKMGGVTLNFFYLQQLPVLPPTAFSTADREYLVGRVVELVYTAWELRAFAQECGYEGAPYAWDEERRAVVRAEVDARIARMYGLSRDELRYILDPQEVYGAEFVGETFRVLKEKELQRYGEYRTQRLVLAAWDSES